MNLPADLLASREKDDVFSASVEGKQGWKHKNALSP
jgi:hypothetical protein